MLADRPDITLIEDNAHGLFGSWQGRPLGSFGRFATLSFHETKNFVCGEGGALVLNDATDIDRARVLYDKGTNRRAFFLGQVDKYTWKDTGSSFGLADVLAAYLLAQLEEREAIQARRRAVYESYQQRLAPYAGELGFRLAETPPGSGSAYHMFYLLLSDRDRRDRVLHAMNESGVHATFHYVPLHTSDAGRAFAAHQTECPVTEDISGRLLRLPFYNNLSHGEIERVVAALVSAMSATSGIYVRIVTHPQPGSSSLDEPDYWWYRARADLLQEVFGPSTVDAGRILDVGSADAPSVRWLHGDRPRVMLDIFPEGLVPGQGVCGSAMALPFADEVFDVVCAFDVVEHCEDDVLALSELTRVLAPEGRLLLSVPAYQWAWSDHDVRAGHHRRYSRPRLHRLVADAGLSVTPLHLRVRLHIPAVRRRAGGPPAAPLRGSGVGSRLPSVSPRAERVLMRLSALDRRILHRWDLPVGSSLFLAATRPVPSAPPPTSDVG